MLSLRFIQSFQFPHDPANTIGTRQGACSIYRPALMSAQRAHTTGDTRRVRPHIARLI